MYVLSLSGFKSFSLFLLHCSNISAEFYLHALFFSMYKTLEAVFKFLISTFVKEEK